MASLGNGIKLLMKIALYNPLSLLRLGRFLQIAIALQCDIVCLVGTCLRNRNNIHDGNSTQQVCQHCGQPGGPSQFGLTFMSARCGRRVHRVCVAEHHSICDDCIGGGAPPVPGAPNTQTDHPNVGPSSSNRGMASDTKDDDDLKKK